jgi:hypothetical protein
MAAAERMKTKNANRNGMAPLPPLDVKLKAKDTTAEQSNNAGVDGRVKRCL